MNPIGSGEYFIKFITVRNVLKSLPRSTSTQAKCWSIHRSAVCSYIPCWACHLKLAASTHCVRHSENFFITPAYARRAMESMATCKFVPATLDGKPVEEIKKMQYVWKLDATAQVNTAPAMIPNTCQRPIFPLMVTPLHQLQDAVVMSFIVGEDGSVYSEKAEQSSGSVAIDRAVLDSLLTCKFKPATLDGKPVSRSQVIRYSLRPVTK